MPYDIRPLRENIDLILTELRPYVESTSSMTWQPSDGFLPLVRRAVLRRQFECLETIVLLADHSKGYAGAPLLRPACEELLWIKYINHLQVDVAERLLKCLALNELAKNLSAQANYAGTSVMRDLGLAAYHARMSAKLPSIRMELSAIGKAEGWGAPSIREGRPPSARFLAKRMNMVAEYDFLYHGSSRYVHFSVAELLRRTWGKEGQVSVASAHFHDYWTAFALFWGLSLLFDTFSEVSKSIGGEMPDRTAERILEAAKRIGEYGQIPLITAEELAWESS